MSALPLRHLVRDTLDGRASEADHVAGRERMLRAFERERATPKRRPTRAFVALLAAALACLGVWFAWPSAALTFTVDGDPVLTADGRDAHVRALESPAHVHFSEGTIVIFGRDTSGRIADVTTRGARIVLGEGELHLDVQHLPEAEWSVEAGPYVVRVTGTSFDVTWRPATGSFEVRMASGSVIVEGPNSPTGVALVAGQALVADSSGSFRVERLGDRTRPRLDTAASAEPQVPEAVSTNGEPAPARPTVGSPAVGTSALGMGSARGAGTASPAPKAEERVTWSTRVADGDYRAVVDEANAQGLETVADSAPLSDLVALADAARYVKDGRAARAALEAQRTRFSSTQAGRTATFLLGRMAEDSDGNAARAIALYDEYLAVGGPFAAEALGRKMVAVERSRGREAAAPIAQAYLQTYPRGGYAGAAGAILETP